MKKIYFFFLMELMCTSLNAQVVNTGVLDTTGGEHLGKIVVSAYIDAYYGYNFSKPASGDIPYLVSMNRHNEANINLAYIDVRYSAKRLRGRFVPGIGTYMNANYSSEPGTLKNVVEATIGIKPFEKKEIWVDFGVMSSPYTNESAISKDHLMYTRSLSAENVPYYLAGAKITTPLGKKMTGYLYLLNGWQQIKDVNAGKSVGLQLEYRPGDKHLLNIDAYLGDERSDVSPLNRMRYFADLYWIYNPEGKVTITSCVYMGWQQVKDTLAGGFNGKKWGQANFIARYKFTEKVSLSGRLEYFSDPGSVLVSPVTSVKGFGTYSTGLCLNVKVFSNALYRIEGRYFFSDQKQYLNPDNEPVNNSTWLISGLTLWF